MTDQADNLYERVLVLRCQTGDEAAFAELMARYGPRLGYYLRKILSDSHVAEDMLQEIWLAVFRGLPRLADPKAFPAWAYRIARDRAWRSLRQRRLKQRPLVEDDLIDDGDEAFRSDDAQAIHAALDELATEHREVLVLRFLEEMTYEDIAKVVGCQLGTVRSRIHYAKRALRRALEKETRIMSEKDLGKALLNLDAGTLGSVPDTRQQTWSILAHDRRRVRFLTTLTVCVWLLSTILVFGGLIGFGIIMPEQAKLMRELQERNFTPAERDEAQRYLLVGFQKGTLMIAFSVAVLSVTAVFTVLLIVASRRATLRHVNASLVEISEQLKGLRGNAPSSSAAAKS